MDLYFKQRASLSAGCVIKPKGNISSFVGFERMGLEPLKVNFKNICSVFSQAPNIPQNPVHFHSLGIAEGVTMVQLPTNTSPAELPGWGLSLGFLCTLGGCHPVQTAADTDILGVSPGNLLKTCSSPSLCQEELWNHPCFCCTHSFSSATYGAGI